MIAGLAAADRRRVRQREVARHAGGVLVDRDQHRHAAALLEGRAHRVARRLRRDHDHVEVGARLDQAVVDVEAVRERERRALLHVRTDRLRVDLRVVLVRQQDHHDVGVLHRFGHFLDGEARAFGLLPRHAALAQADGDLDARVRQVLRVRVALRAVADDRDLLALDQREVGVLVVIHLHVLLLPLP